MDDQTKGTKRRERILQLLKSQGRTTIQEIIEKFDCSEATARRDLFELEKTRLVIRTIGGAQFEGFSGVREVPFQEKQKLLWIEKESIAAKAGSMIDEGDIIGLTGGTTTYLIAKEIKLRRNITVVTNAVNIAMELADSDGIQVVVAGGVLRKNSFELCGPMAEKTVEDLHIGIMFLGADGFTLEQGLTTYSEQEAQIAKLLMKRSLKTIAVFDHSKVGRVSLFNIAPLSQLHACITDEVLSDEWIENLSRLHVPIYLPERVGML